MTISNFVPELWSASVLVPFDSAIVFGQPSVCNRDYEGQIREQGDTVHVSSLSDPTVRSYDKTTDLTTEDLDDDSTALLVDQGDYFSFRVNDVDKVQAAGNFQSPATERAGQKMAGKVDTFLAGIMEAAAGSVVTAESIVKTSPDLAYDLLVEMSTALDKKDAPEAGRFVVVDPDFYGLLRRDQRFTDMSAAGSDATLRNGLIGRGAGFDVLKSNRTPGARVVTDAVTTSSSKTLTSATAKFTAADVGKIVDDGGTKITAGTTIASVESATSVTMSANSAAAGTGISLTIGLGQRTLIAGLPLATSLAIQITETEALRASNRFADIVRGLQVYGGKVFQPDGLAVVSWKLTTS